MTTHDVGVVTGKLCFDKGLCNVLPVFCNIADHQMNMFEDFIGYQSSTVLDEPEREAGTTSIPIPQREESENIPLPDLPGQLENVQQSGNEIAERGMPT